MPDLAELNLLIKSDQVERGQKRLDKLDRSSRRVEQSTKGGTKAFDRQEASVQKLGGGYRRLIGLVARLAAGFSGMAIAMKSVVISAQFEQIEIGFVALLKSEEKAAKMLESLEEFAATTPFQFEGLARGVKQMMAMGFETEKIIPSMRTLGDAAAQLGGQPALESLIRALGQMRAKGKVSGEEMRQLAERGIGAWQYLADDLGKGIPEVMKMAEKGALDLDRSMAAIMVGIQKTFGGGMEKLSKSTLGLWSTLKDNIWFTMRDVGDVIIEAFTIKEKLAGLIELTKTGGAFVVALVQDVAGLNMEFEGNVELLLKITKPLKFVLSILKEIGVTIKSATQILFGVGDAVKENEVAALILVKLIKALAIGLGALMSLGLIKWIYGVTAALWSMNTGMTSLFTMTTMFYGSLVLLTGMDLGSWLYNQFEEAQTTMDNVVSGARTWWNEMFGGKNEVKEWIRILELQEMARKEREATFEGGYGAEGRRRNPESQAFWDAFLGDLSVGLEKMREMVKETVGETPDMIDWAAELENIKKGLEGVAGAGGKAAAAIEGMFKELEHEKSLLGKVNDERERAEKLLKLETMAMAAYGGDVEKVNEILAKYEKELEELQGLRNLVEIGNAAAEAFSKAFVEFINGAAKASDAARAFMDTLIQMSIQKFAMEPISNWFMDFLGGAMKGFFSAGVGTDTPAAPVDQQPIEWGGVTPGALGMVIAGNQVVPFGLGGITSGPEYFPLSGGRMGLRGERGTEGVFPLTRTKDGELGVRAEGGGDIHIHQNIQTPDVDGFRRSSGQLTADAMRQVRRARDM